MDKREEERKRQEKLKRLNATRSREDMGRPTVFEDKKKTLKKYEARNKGRNRMRDRDDDGR